MKRSRGRAFFVGAGSGVVAWTMLSLVLPQVDHPSDGDVVLGVLILVGTAVASGLLAERFWRQRA